MISLIIPAHNEREYIGPLLQSVRKQTRLPEEIVVVCDRCTDDTQAIAEAELALFPSGVHGVTVLADVGDIGGARNVGIEATTGVVLVCLDSDTRLASPDVLAEVERAVENGAFLGGFRMTHDDRFSRTRTQSFLYRMWRTSINLCARFLKNFVGTGCFFQRVPGLMYDPHWGWGEDIEFCHRAKRVAREQGKSVVYLSQAPIVYCDRRFIERGYSKELTRRLKKGLDHLRRERKKQLSVPPI